MVWKCEKIGRTDKRRSTGQQHGCQKWRQQVRQGEVTWLLERLWNLHMPGSNQPRLTKASDSGTDKARHWSDLGSIKIHPRCTLCLYSCLQSPQNSRFAWSTETLLNSAIWIVATQKMAKPCNVLRNQELSTFFNIYITNPSLTHVCVLWPSRFF